MTLGSIIKNYREANGLSLREFGDRCGLSKGYIAMLEKGVRPDSGRDVNPTIKAIHQVADGMGMDFNVLFDKLDGDVRIGGKSKADTESVTIPVLGKVAAGVPIEAIEDIIDTEEISLDMAKRGEYFALQIRGDSMSPSILNGDTVIVKQQPDAENGDIVVACLDGGYATCKKLQKNESGITLISFNPAYEPIYLSNKDAETRDLQILGKAVELRRGLL